MSEVISNPIPYHDKNPSWLSKKLADVPYEQGEKALLVAAIACAVISLIPNLGFIGSLSLRAVSCTMVSMQIGLSLKNQEGKGMMLLHITRLASVVLGLTGLALNIHFLVIAALGINILMQTAQIGVGAHQKDLYKALCHSSFVLIDTFALIAMLTGGWGFAVTAATLNSLVMFVFAGTAIYLGCVNEKFDNEDYSPILEMLCYIALGILGIASAVRCAKIEHDTTKYQYSYTNKTDKTITIYDANGHVVAKVEPGETYKFTLNVRDTYRHGIVYKDAGRDEDSIHPDHSITKTIVDQRPMTAEEFPTLPVDTSALVTQTPTTSRSNHEIETIKNPNLDLFLKPTLPSFVPNTVSTKNQKKINLKLKQTGKSYTFNIVTITKASEFFKGLLEEFEELQDENEIELDLDEKTFDLIADYLNSGIVETSGQLSEEELVKLHDQAEFLLIERLRLLCQMEIALRIKNKSWINTSLLQPYSYATRPLSSLVNLFDFRFNRL